MAAEIKSRFQVEPELIAGGGGIFDVTVDGELVFSRFAEDRFPEDGEVVERITTRTV